MFETMKLLQRTMLTVLSIAALAILGGVAVAASGGNSDGHRQGPPSTSTTAPEAPTSTTLAIHGQGQGQGGETDAADAGGEGDLAGLCDAYDNGSINGRVHKAAGGFEHNALAQAAGVVAGADDVTAAGAKIQTFCSSLGVSVEVAPAAASANGNAGNHGPPPGKGPANPHAHGALSHGHGKP